MKNEKANKVKNRMKHMIVAATATLAALAAAPASAETSLVIEGSMYNQVVTKLEFPLPKDHDIPFQFNSVRGTPIVAEIVNNKKKWGVAESGLTGKLMVINRDDDQATLSLAVEWKEITKLEEFKGISLPEFEQFYTEQVLTLTINDRNELYLMKPNGDANKSLKVFLSDPAYPNYDK